MKWTQMVEAARETRGVASEVSDTERVVFGPKRHARERSRFLQNLDASPRNYTNPHSR